MSLSPGKLVRALTERWLGPRRTMVQVTVRNQDFRIVRVLASEHELAAFSSMWATRIKVDYRSWVPPSGRDHHKLDIRWRERSGRMRTYRWLYHPDGVTNLLTIWRPPLYRMPSPSAFETLLRSQDPESTGP
jgi:hypothetical protein